jgi:hypothetical protein
MAQLLMPTAFQKQYDLQHDFVNAMLQLDDTDTQLTPDLRARLTALKTLSTEIQRGAHQDDVSSVEDDGDGQDNSVWSVVIKELIELGQQALEGWLRPGRAVTLFNNTDSPIFVRTFDQNDNWRWVAYGTYTIGARNYATIYARGDNNIQADIRGRVYRCAMGLPQAYTGDSVIART